MCKVGCSGHHTGEFYTRSRHYRLFGRRGALNTKRALEAAYPLGVYAIYRNGRKTRW